MNKIVIHLEDDYIVRESFKLAFSKFSNYILKQFEMPSLVKRELYKKAYVIISDYDMQNETALEMLKYLDDNDLKTKVIMYSGNEENYEAIKNKKLDKNIVFWANKLTPISNIINMINNLNDGFTK